MGQLVIPSGSKVYVDTAVLIYTLEATNSIKTPDAIHAATALSVNCDLFITNDNGFRNLSNLSVVILSEVLAS